MTRFLTSLLALFAGAAFAAEATLELAAPFTDDMILQRDTKVPVWGFDKPGSMVTVEFAGQNISAVADKQGDWKLALDPLPASATERSFKVTNNHGQGIELKGVLVGEVWFSSGQSNMVWVAGKSMCSGIAQELAQSDKDIPIREININTISAIYPQKHATSDGGWKKSKHASQFSALSLSFAHELHKELGVPIGILLSAHSNTRIEAFTARPAIEAHPALEGDAELIHLGDPLTGKGAAAFRQYEADLRAWQTEAAALSEAGGSIPPRPNLPGIAGMWRGPSQFFSGKIAPVVPYAVRGAIWCQGTSNGGDGRIYAARMEALLRGWRDAWGMPDMPFYFTQQQCYGSPEPAPDNVGFADLRQAQHLFFINNRKNVGMVVQTDLNPARPQGIHYPNKLHPGMRLARWALAKDYGKDIAHTGPIYSGYTVKDDKVVVSFEKDSLFGGLMAGSKGMAANAREPGGYVEPARPTPGESLNHFRLCGKDGKWHAANAGIAGDTIIVQSKAVPKPVGVQYAYNAVPMNSNLYNKAGLPATPFCAVEGELIFQAAKPSRGGDPDEVRPMLQFANYLRDGAVIQRDQAIPLWGHANAGAKITATLGGVTRSATANELEQWSMSFPPMQASSKPITLSVETSLGAKRGVKDILVGDVWFLTGSPQLNGEMAWDQRHKDAKPPATLPLVREFRKKTKASTNPTPRKRWFETGGGRYGSSWITADFSGGKEGVSMFAYHFATALNRPLIPQGFITMSAGSSGRSAQFASPLSWTSFDGVKDIKDPAFQDRINELMLQYPGSEIARKALEDHIAAVKAAVQTITTAANQGADLSAAAPQRFPGFPEAGKNSPVSADMIPTYAHNWCVAPFAPMAAAGVVWVPAQPNIGPNAALYARELEIFANSLPATFGGKDLTFLHAQPADSLAKGITAPKLAKAQQVTLGTWPKSLEDLARQFAAKVNP